jgi:hypothetical protein
VYGYNVTHCDLNRKIALKNALKKMSFQDVKLKLQMGSRLMGKIMPKIGEIYNKDIAWLQLLNKYISKKKHALRNVKKYKK